MKPKLSWGEIWDPLSNAIAAFCNVDSGIHQFVRPNH